MQICSGIGIAYAVCDNEIRTFCSADAKTPNSGHELCDGRRDKEIKDYIKQFAEERKNYQDAEDERKNRKEHYDDRIRSAMSVNRDMSIAYKDAMMCIVEYSLSLNQNVTPSNQPSNSGTSSNQPSNSGVSSSQSTSPQPSAQGENNQNNTQTTTSKKGKKNPNAVPANCVKFNHDKTKIVNVCNFPINFTFCMLHQDDQSIPVANSCNNGFVEETVYPGRAISDESLDTRFFAVSCKFPSKPIKTRFISFNEPLEGNCPR